MVWDPTHPATSSGVVSAPLRDNFAALDTLLVVPLSALANNQVLVKGAGPVVGGVPAGTNGYLLTLVGGVPLWQPAPSLTWPLLAPDGTAAAPSYSFTGFPGAGLYILDAAVFGEGLPTLAYRGARFVVGYATSSDPLDSGFCYQDARGGFLEFFTYGSITTFTLYPPTLDHSISFGWDTTTGRGFLKHIGATGLTIAPDATIRIETKPLELPAVASAATPAANFGALYFKTDKKLYQKTDVGVETPVGSVAAVVVPLGLDAARFPDGTAGNLFPQPIERISTGTPPANYPKLVELVYQFDATAIEHLIWKTAVPAGYAGGGITVVLKWSMLTATTGNIRAMVGMTSVADAVSGLAPIVTATAITADVAVPATAGVQKETRLVPSGGTPPVAGHKLLVTVSLLGATAGNATGDRVLEAAWLEFTL